MICLADMAFWMSNFDDFDSHQISWKLAQRWRFVFAFYCKFFFFLGNQDCFKNTKWNLFENHPISHRDKIFRQYSNIAIQPQEQIFHWLIWTDCKCMVHRQMEQVRWSRWVDSSKRKSTIGLIFWKKIHELNNGRSAKQNKVCQWIWNEVNQHKDALYRYKAGQK